MEEVIVGVLTKSPRPANREQWLLSNLLRNLVVVMPETQAVMERNEILENQTSPEQNNSR